MAAPWPGWADMPLDSWALLLLAVGLGLALEVWFYVAQRGRREGGSDSSERPTAADSGDPA